ncbi:hypothetical protein [Azospirillum argentinense]|uniref:class I SAM-dependent methyltransferase n=1 Tax=Azospirillum argentinense TaxID=2970906 RepID=UPI0032DFED52
MTVADPQDRFAFGKNWQGFLDHHFSEERVTIAQKHLLDFLRLPDLRGKTVLDIGSGSGIHSLGMWRAGAERVISFDYDPNSVAATQALHARSGAPRNWTVTRGSVLDANFMAGLPKADIVYSWGVLHHTGAQWTALRHACGQVAEDGLLYIALYTADAYIRPTPEDWLRIKKAYNAGGWLKKRWMELDYIWFFMARRSLSGLLKVPGMARSYRQGRGMSMMVDLRDWLGGWPMEFSTLREVLSLCQDELGFSLRRLASDEPNSEYLFARRPEPGDLTPAVREIRSLAELSESRPLYVYGAGLGGDLLLPLLEDATNQTVSGLIDKFKSGEKHGLPILNLEEAVRTLPKDTPIVVSLAQFGAVAADLVKAGFTNVINANPVVVEQRRRLGI